MKLRPNCPTDGEHLIPAELMDARQSERMLGTRFWHGGMLNPTGGHINPLGLARGLARAAEAHGARICETSPVTNWRQNADGWQVDTERGSIRARALVLATSSYTDSIVGKLAPRLSRTIVPVLSWQISTEPLGDNIRATVLPGKRPPDPVLRSGWLMVPGHEVVDKPVRPVGGEALEGLVSQACGSTPLSFAVARSVAMVAQVCPPPSEPANRAFLRVSSFSHRANNSATTRDRRLGSCCLARLGRLAAHAHPRGATARPSARPSRWRCRTDPRCEARRTCASV